MQAIDHGLRVGITFGVHDMGTDGERLPVIPVVYDDVDRYMVLAITGARGKHFALPAIAVLALEQSKSPFGKHRRAARGIAIKRNDMVETGTIKEIIVDHIA